jgi:hypothetical protein
MLGVQFVVHLKTQPEFRGCPEETTETKGRICGHAPTATYNLIDPARGHTDPACQGTLTQFHRHEELFQQNLTGMKGFQFPSHVSHLVIVHNLNFIGLTGPPHEANSELVIHADTVLTLPVSLERFQAVAWWYPQVLQRLRTVKHSQFPERHPMDVLGKTLRSLSAK